MKMKVVSSVMIIYKNSLHGWRSLSFCGYDDNDDHDLDVNDAERQINIRERI
jgi:hypothetical protein